MDISSSSSTKKAGRNRAKTEAEEKQKAIRKEKKGKKK